MNKNMLTLVAVTIMLALGGTLRAQEAGWVHLRVDGDEQVQLNLPISMVAIALEAIRAEGLGDLRAGGGDDVPIGDARRMWQAMREAGDAEFINLQDGDERMRVYREGDRIYVEANEGDTESLSIEMPVQIADALLASEGEQVDFNAVVQELVRQGESDLVLIRDGEQTIRLWADNRSDQDE